MDTVLDFGTQENFNAAMKTLGFWDSTSDTPVTQIQLPHGGSAFLNIVGPVSDPTGNTVTQTGPDGSTYKTPEMSAPHGYWARLRWNGDTSLAPDLPPGVTEYLPYRLLADGTPDPNYTQPPYGVIA